MEISKDLLLSKIHVIRNQKVLLDFELAQLYGVETKYLKRQVRRNIDRFPADFMFEITKAEWSNLRCHFGTSNLGGNRYSPMAFTEQGVAQLSSVLRSDTAIQINIQIIRLFTKMRSLLYEQSELILKIQKMEGALLNQNAEIRLLFKYIKSFQSKSQEAAKRRKIGFKNSNQ